jgi:hypothetical protein
MYSQNVNSTVTNDILNLWADMEKLVFAIKIFISWLKKIRKPKVEKWHQKWGEPRWTLAKTVSLLIFSVL